MITMFLDPWPWPEGSYELGSVLPSIHLSVRWSVLPSVLLYGSFLGIGSLVFSETVYVVRAPYGDVHDRT